MELSDFKTNLGSYYFRPVAIAETSHIQYKYRFINITPARVEKSAEAFRKQNMTSLSVPDVFRTMRHI